MNSAAKKPEVSSCWWWRPKTECKEAESRTCIQWVDALTEKSQHLIFSSPILHFQTHAFQNVRFQSRFYSWVVTFSALRSACVAVYHFLSPVHLVTHVSRALIWAFFGFKKWQRCADGAHMDAPLPQIWCNFSLSSESTLGLGFAAVWEQSEGSNQPVRDHYGKSTGASVLWGKAKFIFLSVFQSVPFPLSLLLQAP